MTRLLTLVTVIFAIISLASAQFVDTLNTPLGPVTQGANVQVSWTLLAGVDATGKTGELSATDSTSKNTITIDPAVQLAPKVYTWNVKVPPGTYTLGLNDGSGLKQSGEVVVKAPASGGPPAPSGSASTPASPAAGSSTAGAPAATGGSGGGSSSGGGSGAGGSSSGGGSGAGGSGGGGGTVSGDAPTDTSSQPSTLSSPKSSSASFIFSGYEVVFSLLVVATAMVQF